jgi:hypothetical protein
MKKTIIEITKERNNILRRAFNFLTKSDKRAEFYEHLMANDLQKEYQDFLYEMRCIEHDNDWHDGRKCALCNADDAGDFSGSGDSKGFMSGNESDR